MTGIGVVLTVAGRVWAVVFICIGVFLVGAWAYGAMYDLRERRRQRIADVIAVRERIAELNREAIDESDFSLWQRECGWDRGYR